MIDILAIGAHPDDIEAGAAGLLIRAKKSGLKTGIIILTKGEAGAFAESSTRVAEAEKAAGIIAPDFFKIMDFKDSGLEDTAADAAVLAPVIRECSPKIIVAPWCEDVHPDHVAASQLVDRASFVAGRNTDGKGIWEPEQILYFSLNFKNLKAPDLVIDISQEIETKKQALMAHATQYGPILAGVELLGRYYGALYGSMYAEGFIKKNPLKLRTLAGII